MFNGAVPSQMTNVSGCDANTVEIEPRPLSEIPRSFSEKTNSGATFL